MLPYFVLRTLADNGSSGLSGTNLMISQVSSTFLTEIMNEEKFVNQTVSKTFDWITK